MCGLARHNQQYKMNQKYHMDSTGCSLKIVFFPYSLQPFPCLKESNASNLRSQCKVTPIGWPFSSQPIAAQLWRGRDRQLLKILGKNTIFNEHLVHQIIWDIMQFKKRENNRIFHCQTSSEKSVLWHNFFFHLFLAA